MSLDNDITIDRTQRIEDRIKNWQDQLALLPYDEAIEVVTGIAGWPGYDTHWQHVPIQTMYSLLAVYQSRALDVQTKLLGRIGHSELPDHYVEQFQPR